MDTIQEYRAITGNEYQVIRCLEQIHAQLVGDYYYQHPAMDSIAAHEIVFAPI